MLFKRKNAIDNITPQNKLSIRKIVTGVYRICNKQDVIIIDDVRYNKVELHDATGLKIGLYENTAIDWVNTKP